MTRAQKGNDKGVHLWHYMEITLASCCLFLSSGWMLLIAESPPHYDRTITHGEQVTLFSCISVAVCLKWIGVLETRWLLQNWNQALHFSFYSMTLTLHPTAQTMACLRTVLAEMHDTESNSTGHDLLVQCWLRYKTRNPTAQTMRSCLYSGSWG